MKILFIGDYSNLHASLARELRRRGHTVTILSDGCGHMNVEHDIYVRRDGNRIFGGAVYLYRLFQILPRLRGYDVVQMINPHFFHLKPGKLRYFLHELKGYNGSLFLSLAGNDHYFLRACLDGTTFRFSEYRTGVRPTEFARRNRLRERGYMMSSVEVYTHDFYKAIDGAMAVLPEYHMAASPILGDRVCFTNLPVDLDELQFSEMDMSGKVKVLVGMRSGYELSKGTDTLLGLAHRVEKRIPDMMEVVNVRDLSWEDYKKVLRQCHINLDQLYSYSPAMNALGSMAMGRVAASGAEPEYYDMIGETELRPVFHLSPLIEDLDDRLQELVSDRDRLVRMGRDSRRLVEKHNSVELVADRYEQHWEKMMAK